MSLHVARRSIRDEILIQKFLTSTLVRDVTKPLTAGVSLDKERSTVTYLMWGWKSSTYGLALMGR